MIWKGHVSFGLVNIPVALHPAAVREELDVPRECLTRGFEHRAGRYVIVTDDDLRRASPERTQQIDILSFTDPRRPPGWRHRSRSIDLMELLKRSVEKRRPAVKTRRSA